MIIGTSHAILTVQDSPSGIQALEALGYTCKFVEKQVPNHPSKQKFLSQEYITHDLTFMTASNGLPIELVNYGSSSLAPASATRIFPVFDAPPPKKLLVEARIPDLAKSVNKAFGVTNSITASILGLPNVTACFLGGANSNCGLKAIVCPVTNVNRTKETWCKNLGFTPVKTESGFARIDFKSPIATWNLSVILVPTTTQATLLPLDSPGMHGLSMLCTKLKQDRLQASGSEIGKTQTRPFQTTIDSKRLLLEILELSNNFYLELIQVLATKPMNP